MPTYKNVSDEDVAGIVGVGLIKPGEVKTVADPVDHPSLKRVDDEEAHQLQSTEPETDQAPVEAELEQPAPNVQPQQPTAPQTPPSAQVVQPQQPQNTNPNPSQGA